MRLFSKSDSNEAVDEGAVGFASTENVLPVTELSAEVFSLVSAIAWVHEGRDEKEEELLLSHDDSCTIWTFNFIFIPLF